MQIRCAESTLTSLSVYLLWISDAVNWSQGQPDKDFFYKVVKMQLFSIPHVKLI